MATEKTGKHLAYRGAWPSLDQCHRYASGGSGGGGRLLRWSRCHTRSRKPRPHQQYGSGQQHNGVRIAGLPRLPLNHRPAHTQPGHACYGGHRYTVLLRLDLDLADGPRSSERKSSYRVGVTDPPAFGGRREDTAAPIRHCGRLPTRPGGLPVIGGCCVSWR